MKNIYFIIAFCCLPLFATAQVNPKEHSDDSTKIAVYVDDDNMGLADFVSATFVDAFVHNSNFIALERTDDFLKAVNSEHQYQRSGMIDDQQIARLGKQSGTKYVCIVRIGVLNDEYFMMARLLDVETANIVNSTSPSCFSFDELKDVCIKIVTQLLSANNSKRTIQDAFGY